MTTNLLRLLLNLPMMYTVKAMYSLRPKKKVNLGLDVIYYSTMSRFVVLGCVTSSTRLVFYGTMEYDVHN
jgi:hypothetical protein